MNLPIEKILCHVHKNLESTIQLHKKYRVFKVIKINTIKQELYKKSTCDYARLRKKKGSLSVHTHWKVMEKKEKFAALKLKNCGSLVILPYLSSFYKHGLRQWICIDRRLILLPTDIIFFLFDSTNCDKLF